MGALHNLEEEWCGCAIVGRMTSWLVVLGFVFRGVEKCDSKVDREDLGVGVLLSQTAGVQQGLIGPVCKLSAVHGERECRVEGSVESKEGHGGEQKVSGIRYRR